MQGLLKSIIRAGTTDVCRDYSRASYADAFGNKTKLLAYTITLTYWCELLLQYKITGRSEKRPVEHEANTQTSTA